MTTSGAFHSRGPPSTENCRSSRKLTSGRRAVDVKGQREASLSPLSGRRQLFHDAVFADRGAAVRGRCSCCCRCVLLPFMLPRMCRVIFLFF